MDAPRLTGGTGRASPRGPAAVSGSVGPRPRRRLRVCRAAAPPSSPGLSDRGPAVVSRSEPSAGPCGPGPLKGPPRGVFAVSPTDLGSEAPSEINLVPAGVGSPGPVAACVSSAPTADRQRRGFPKPQGRSAGGGPRGPASALLRPGALSDARAELVTAGFGARCGGKCGRVPADRRGGDAAIVVCQLSLFFFYLWPDYLWRDHLFFL